MHKGLVVAVSAAGRVRLEPVVATRTRPQQHVRRARFVLPTRAGHGAALIMRWVGVSKAAIGRRQEQLMAAGIGGHLGWLFHLTPTSANGRMPDQAASPSSPIAGRTRRTRLDLRPSGA
jgi:hypothetical protein